MYRFFSLFFAVFLFISCGSGNVGTNSGTDSGHSHGKVDADNDSVTDIDDTDDIDDNIDEPDDDDIDEPDDDDIDEPDDDDIDEPDDDDIDEPDDDDIDEPDDDDIEGPDDYVCGGGLDIENPDSDSVKIRIVAGNITSGNDQSYDPGHGIRIFQALKPDIALVQEMNYKNNSDNDYESFAQQIVGTDCYAVDSADYQIPNGVVSRYPIKSKGYWKDPNINNRALMWAVVDIPGEKDIFAISVHLHTSPASDQIKAAQVIVDEIAKVKANNPGKYYYVVGGDFNGDSAVSSNGFGKNSTFYVDGPDPVDEDGYAETNRNRNKQYDFVLADYPMHEFQVPVIYYSSEDPTKTKCYEDGLVFDTRLYSQSELDEYFSPADINDSGASQMQHMAVVKDFLIELK